MASAAIVLAVSLAGLAVLFSSCGRKQEAPEKQAETAKARFEQITRDFHIPSAQAVGAERVALQARAADGYQRLLADYPSQSFWAAQALRNLGGIRAAQTNLNEAVRLYAAVAEKYPAEEFEVVQAWKAAGDLLWEAQRLEEARQFYRKLVGKFDGTNQPAVVRLAVRGAKAKLETR